MPQLEQPNTRLFEAQQAALRDAMAGAGDAVSGAFNYTRALNEKHAEEDRTRRQRLEDIAGTQKFISQEAIDADKRRQKDAVEADNRQYALGLSKQGITTRDENGELLPRRELEKRESEYQKNVAENLLAHFDTEQENVNAKRETALQEIKEKATKAASPEINRTALIATMADSTATKFMSDAEKKAINDALNSTLDPNKAVTAVYQEMVGKHGFLRFTKAATAQSRASNFFQFYLNKVNELNKEGRQLDVSLSVGNLTNLDAESRQISANREKHVLDYANWLPKSVVTGVTQAKAKEIPADPRTVVSPTDKALATSGVKAPTLAATTPPPVTDNRFLPPSVTKDPAFAVAREVLGDISKVPPSQIIPLAKNKVQSNLDAMLKQMDALSSQGIAADRVSPTVTSNIRPMYPGGVNIPYTQEFSQSEMIARSGKTNEVANLAADIQKTRRNLATLSGAGRATMVGTSLDQTPIAKPATFAEKQQMKKAAIDMNGGVPFSQEQEDQFQRDVDAGIPERVHAWNVLLDRVRGGGAMPTPQVNGSSPVFNSASY